MIASDLMNLAEFKSLVGYDGPCIHFLHENQLTYPLPENDRGEMHFGFVNLVSAMVADLNIFNSEYHYRKFEQALPKFVNNIPEFVPLNSLGRVLKKPRHASSVVILTVLKARSTPKQSAGDFVEPSLGI